MSETWTDVGGFFSRGREGHEKGVEGRDRGGMGKEGSCVEEKGRGGGC